MRAKPGSHNLQQIFANCKITSGNNQIAGTQ